jgi:hypothetical protein
MSIEGRVAVDVSFADSATSGGVQSLKKITLSDTQAYTSGKVAIVTGTVGTAGATVFTQPMSPEYKDASGSVVSFSSVSALAFKCSRDCSVSDPDGVAGNRIRSNGSSCVTDWVPEGPNLSIEANFTSGTASYTLVLYGT